MADEIRVAIVQRILPHYRIPIFNRIAGTEGVNLIVYYGKGVKTGVHQNSPLGEALFKTVQLPTFRISVKKGVKKFFLVFHWTLFFKLLKGNYDVVITEGGQNIINNIGCYFFLKPFVKSKFIWWGPGLKRTESNSNIGKLFFVFYKKLLSKSDATLGYSTKAREFHIKMGKERSKAFIAQNTIDEKTIENAIVKYEGKFTEYKSRYNPESNKVIITVGSLEPRKKIELLIEAVKEVEKKGKVSLWIIGDGPHRRKLEQITDEWGMKTVKFFGKVGDDIAILFQIADLFVLPAHGGLAINEAMIHGKPVIATYADGTEEDLIVSGQNGYIIEENDVNKLAETIGSVLFDDARLKRMGKCSIERYYKHFTVENMVSSYVNAIRATLES